LKGLFDEFFKQVYIINYTTKNSNMKRNVSKYCL